MLLQVIHETHYAYTPPVETAQHLAHLKPLDTASQQLLKHHIEITPAPVQRTDSADAYGNARTFFALESTHEELSVVAHSLVRTSTPALPASRAMRPRRVCVTQASERGLSPSSTSRSTSVATSRRCW